MKTTRTFSLMILAIFLVGLFSCNNQPAQSTETKSDVVEPKDAFPLMMRHLEREKDYINTKAPSLITAKELRSEQSNKIAMIDIRSKIDFTKGHIEHAVNVPMSKVLDYLLNDIYPSKLEKVVLICDNGQTSSYVVSVLRLAGYQNAFALKFGMAAWNRSLAMDNWRAVSKKDLSAKLESKINPIPEKGKYPSLPTCESTCSEAMEKMTQELLNRPPSSLSVTIEEIIDPSEEYFIISYLPAPIYKSGHIPGSINYAPKASLKRDSLLKTLPTDKTIVTYCYSGQHAAFVTGYLNLIGYKAKYLEYGSMGFVNEWMKNNGWKHFSEQKILKNFPIVVE